MKATLLIDGPKAPVVDEMRVILFERNDDVCEKGVEVLSIGILFMKNDYMIKTPMLSEYYVGYVKKTTLYR